MTIPTHREMGKPDGQHYNTHPSYHFQQKVRGREVRLLVKVVGACRRVGWDERLFWESWRLRGMRTPA